MTPKPSNNVEPAEFANEVWKPIPSMPGVLASNLGRIYVLPYEAPMPYGGVRVYEGFKRFGNLRGNPTGDGFRYWLQLRGKNYRVARLVCEAFHGPANGLNCLHIDENSMNNRASNLEWGTQKKNLNAPGFIEYCRGRTGENSPYTKGMKLKLLKES